MPQRVELLSSSHCPQKDNNVTPSVGSSFSGRKGASPSGDDRGGSREHVADEEIPGLHVRRDGVVSRKNNHGRGLWYACSHLALPIVFLSSSQVLLLVDSSP